MHNKLVVKFLRRRERREQRIAAQAVADARAREALARKNSGRSSRKRGVK